MGVDTNIVEWKCLWEECSRGVLVEATTCSMECGERYRDWLSHGNYPASALEVKINNGEFVVKDSGERRHFPSGAQRDTGDRKGLFHLIPYYPLERLAKVFEAGSIKYGRSNWRKGMPCSVFADSAARHLLKLLDGWQDEDHAAQAMWNICAYIWTEHEAREGRLAAELLDMPHQETK